MTALLDLPPVAPAARTLATARGVRLPAADPRGAVRPAGTEGASWDASRRSPRWSAVAARGGAPERTAVAVPVAPAPGASRAPATRLQWTERGVAVMVTLVLVVVGVLVGTLLSAFLAVSPEPVRPDVAAGAASTVGVPLAATPAGAGAIG